MKKLNVIVVLNKPNLLLAQYLEKAGSIFNNLIHSEITKSSKSDLMDMDTLYIDEQISNLNPSLWAFIVSITCTVRKGETTEDGAYVKKLRCYYLICLLLLCTNSLSEVCGGHGN